VHKEETITKIVSGRNNKGQTKHIPIHKIYYLNQFFSRVYDEW
jgi:hypothetical protein